MKHNLFIISGPAGVGKNTIINTLLSDNPDFTTVPSYTTRPSREEDMESKARLCVSNDIFQQMIDRGELIEYKHVHNWFYGRRKSDIINALKNHLVVILEIDVKGLPTYKKLFPDATSIFLNYENVELLRHRIRANRPDSTEADIETRYQTALNEIKNEKDYDHSVTNIEGHPEKAISVIQEIISKSIAN